MAKMDRINLIKEFSVQKKNKFIVLTTFNFDSYFFDLYLLPLLQKQNIGTEIIILIDEGQYNLQFSKFTSITGVSYHLIPIRLKRGVFHPKFFMFVSDKSITTFCGSANITLQGFTNNAELVLKTVNTEDKSSEVNEIKNILEKLIKDKIIENEQVINIVNHVSEIIDKKKLVENKSRKTIHNLLQPILDQVLQEISEKDFEELFILAPFISEDGKPLEKILEKVSIKKIIFALQKGNHTLTTLKNIENICDKFNTQLEIKSVEFIEKISEKELDVQRRFHSKIIFFRGQNSYLVTGSPNFTSSALLESMSTGNFEFGILWKEPSNDILNSLKIESVKNTSGILSTSRPQFLGNIPSFIHIKSVTFNIKNGKLKIIAEPKKESYQIKISLKDTNPIISTENFSSGIIEISLSQKIPTEIEITDGANSIKRRIYDDSDIRKRISRSGFSISVWTEKVGEILNMDNSTMLEIIRILNDYVRIEVEPTKSSGERTKIERMHDYIPSSIKSPKNFATTINLIGNILEKNQQQKNFQKSVEEESTDDEMNQLENESTTHFDQYDSLTEIKNWIENIYLLLLSVNKKNSDESLINSITVYVATFLKFVPGILRIDEVRIESLRESSSNMAFEIFKNNLINMFQYLSPRDLINGHSQNLLLHLLCLKYLTGISIHHINLGIVLLDHDFANKKLIYDMSEFVKEFLKKYEINFNKEFFIDGYLHYGSFGFKNDTENKIKNLVHIISNEQDIEFLEYLKKLFTKVFEKYQKNLFNDLEYNMSSEGGKFVHKMIENYEDPHAWMDKPW